MFRSVGEVVFANVMRDDTGACLETRFGRLVNGISIRPPAACQVVVLLHWAYIAQVAPKAGESSSLIHLSM